MRRAKKPAARRKPARQSKPGGKTRTEGSLAKLRRERDEARAQHAVVAMENARLITEQRESLDRQTALADVLKAINSSRDDLVPVFQMILEKAHGLCGVEFGSLQTWDGEKFQAVVVHNLSPALEERLKRGYIPGLNSPGRRLIAGQSVVHIPDIAGIDDPIGRVIAENDRLRTLVHVALRKDQTLLGQIVAARPEVRAFTDKEIALLENFAAQAVIAIENVRLFAELRDSLERLKAAQANLIQAEKMASLGQLTAGIAHEIKNPLNFVNNFAGLSSELVDELKQGMDAVLAAPDEARRAELQDTLDLLTANLAKIVEHGRRADGIVKSMLAHSRGGTGDWQSSNINGLVEEALNLAYHGARAQDQSFNVTLERDFGEVLKPIDVVPQDVTRVFLNLIGNGFYATRKRQRENAGDGYQPTLRVSTRDLGKAVEIRVRDNGIGIAPDVRAKLFQPFFTTKPTGEGTGLGLSISYDIVTQQHDGSIEVESEVGQFSEFVVRLPRARRVAAAPGERA